MRKTAITLPKLSGFAAATLLAAGIFIYVAACVPTPSRQTGKFARKECLDCHTEFAAKYLKMKDVHAVVKEQKCEDCHLRHGIIPKLLLKRQGNDVCYSCHPPDKIGLKKVAVHTALKTGKCTDCHNPHASQTPPC